MIKIYNTMSRMTEVFQPIHSQEVSMYVCGPTVYNNIHIGNARSVVAFDVIRRYLEFRGFSVRFVMNLTDIDDKIIAGADQAGLPVSTYTEQFISAYFKDLAYLNVKSATVNPKVSDYIPEIIDFIAVLIEKGFAYEAKGDVYFRVAKSENYGKLANKVLSDLIDGASGRIDTAMHGKENQADFTLWKNESSEAAAWSSPWGPGRPGWHIECSVLATEILGDTFDIHGGGIDLEFPHHPNEIAQSEAKTGQKFVNYWMHNAFLEVDNEKMSKSLNNFTTVKDISENAPVNVLRFYLATAHYRKPLHYHALSLVDANKNLKKIETAYRHFNHDGVDDLDALAVFKTNFINAMDEDFNIANGLTAFYDFISWVNKGNGGDMTKQFFDDVLTILGIHFENEQQVIDSEIEALIQARTAARMQQDFQKSDEIRNDLFDKGIILEDTKEGTRWSRRTM